MNTLSSLLKFIANSIAPIISDQTAKKVLAAPNGATGKPSFRELQASDITSGVFTTDRIPNLDASKINSGVLGTSRIPSLDASKVTSGVFNSARIPNWNTINGAVTDAIIIDNITTTSTYNFTAYQLREITKQITMRSGYTPVTVKAYSNNGALDIFSFYIADGDDKVTFNVINRTGSAVTGAKLTVQILWIKNALL